MRKASKLLLAVLLVFTLQFAQISPAFAASNSYYPSGYNLQGTTTLSSGAIGDVNADDASYMTFDGYISGTSNILANSGFESAGTWTATVLNGGVAAEQYATNPGTGTYSGQTDSSSCSSTGWAKLNQSFTATTVSSIPDQAGTLTWDIRNGGIVNFYYPAELRITSSQGNSIHYWYRLDSSALPTDTSTDKYIDMGTSLTLDTWVNASRNFYSDWVTTKSLPSSDTINLITLHSDGDKITGKRHGQALQWDEIYLSQATEYTASVEFTGTSDTDGWTQLDWITDSA